MPDQTKTIVVIERHEQTIIRRSRRTVSGQPLMDAAVARPSGRVPADVMEPTVQEKPKSLGRWWKAVVLKSATALEPWSRRLKNRGDKRTNELLAPEEPNVYSSRKK